MKSGVFPYTLYILLEDGSSKSSTFTQVVAKCMNRELPWTAAVILWEKKPDCPSG